MVGSTPERPVLVGPGAAQVQRVCRVPPLIWISIGGTEGQEEEGSGRCGDSVDLQGFRANAPSELHRRVESYGLLDRVRIEARVGSHTVELIGEFEEVHQSVPDKVERILVSRHVEEHHLGYELLVAESVA